MSKSVVVEWQGGLRFDAGSGVGGSIVLVGDEGVEGMRPTEALLSALASCTAMDVVAICRKKRQPIERYQVEVTGIQRDAHPRMFETISVEHRVWGTALDDRAVSRSIWLSASRYCPVSANLASGAVTIEHRYVIEDQAGQRSAPVVVVGPFGAGMDPQDPQREPAATAGNDRSAGPM